MAQSLIDLLRETHADAVASAHSEKGDEVVTVPRERLVDLCRFLKDDPRTEMKLLHMVTADESRTPTFTIFANPDYHVQAGAPDCSGFPAPRT